MTKNVPSIRPAALSPVINWLRNGCDPAKAADELELIVAKPAPSVPEGWKEAADHIIDFLQSQYDTEGIAENDSGDALIRLSGAIAAVEEVLLAAAPKPGVK